MKKALMLISQDAEVSKLSEELRGAKIKAEEQLLFLKKQFMNIQNKMQKQSESIWEDMEKRLEALKIYPSEYSKEKHYLCCDQEEGAIYMVDKDSAHSQSIPGLLKQILENAIAIEVKKDD